MTRGKSIAVGALLGVAMGLAVGGYIPPARIATAINHSFKVENKGGGGE